MKQQYYWDKYTNIFNYKKPNRQIDSSRDQNKEQIVSSGDKNKELN